MKLTGNIYGHNNQPVTALITVIHPNGDVETLEIAAGEIYVIDADEPYLRALQVIFSAQGYKSIETTGAKLIDTGKDIYLRKTNTIFLLVVAAGLFYALSAKKKRVGKLTVQEVKPFILIAGAVMGFFILKQLLEMLGIWKDKDDKALDAAGADANSFWSPEYWKLKPSGVEYTRPITESTAKGYATEIYNAFSWINDCEECVKAVFKRLPSQASASFVSYAFNKTYGMDLLDFLRGGTWPQDRLSSADVNEINRYVATLPKY
jgi:hypothetical protein